MAPQLPHIEPQLLSSNFVAPLHALQVVAQSDPARAAHLAHLRALRSELLHYLRETAPQWPALLAASAAQTDALRQSQRASALLRDAAALRARPPASALHLRLAVRRAAGLSATLALAGVVRRFASLCVDVFEGDELLRAARLAECVRLVESPPLVHLDVLKDARSRLDALKMRLGIAISQRFVRAVFGAPDAHPGDRQLNCAQLARALAQLQGDQSPANVLKQQACSKLLALFKQALQLESDTSFAHAPSAIDESVASAHPFVLHPHQKTARRACAVAFRRVVHRMQIVLERLCQLYDDLKQQLPTVADASVHVWRTMQGLLSVFLQTVLNLNETVPQSSLSSSHDMPLNPNEKRISLLPSYTSARTSATTDSRATSSSSSSWQAERLSSADTFATMLKNVSYITPSIYNLEVIHAPLHKFMTYAAAFERKFKDVEPGVPPPNFVSLPLVVRRAAHHFLSSVQHDVTCYMQHSFGPRAGTLLQPFSLRSSAFGAGDYVLPSLCQTQMLLTVISSCLSMAVAVPTLAESLGCLIEQIVIMPFVDRALYALNLAKSWTDAGGIVDAVVDRVGEMVRKSDKDDEQITKRESGSGKQRSARNGSSRRTGLLRTLRKKPELTVECLKKWVDERVERGVGVTDLTVLSENEWNAVVRLVANAQTVIKELENCVSKKGRKHLNSVAAQMNGKGGPSSRRGSSKNTIRNFLLNRGIANRANGSIALAIGRTVRACQMLKEQVIERGLVLLHAEITMYCFVSVVNTLVVEQSVKCYKGMVSPKMVVVQEGEAGVDSGVEIEQDGGELYTGDDGAVVNEKSVEKEGDGRAGYEKATAETSAIFKVSTLKIHEDATVDEWSHGKIEFDEFGDRIVMGNEDGVDVEGSSEDHGVASSGPEQCGGGKTCGNETGGKDEGGNGMLSEWDGRARDLGREFGRRVQEKHMCVRQNVEGDDEGFVIGVADGGVAVGIETAGRLCGRANRDVAVGAKLFLDAAGGVAADTLGWPDAETEYSVAEGTSQSGSECRRLLYAAGML